MSDDQLQRAVSAPARAVCRALRDAGYQAYVVGGAVRDALLGREVLEWDVATDALPEEVQRVFPRTIPTGIQHGTVTVLTGPPPRLPIEVTTFRGEGDYTDARRPDSVTFGVPLREDLARRDFVVNAMAYDPIDGTLVDPFGGRDDLAARRLRAVGVAGERFREDGLRVMRGVRFVATLEFELDPATEAAIAPALPSLAKVAIERVHDELIKLLRARDPARGLRAASRTGVLATVMPELSPDERLFDALAAMPVDPMLRAAALFAPLGARGAERLCKRLRMSRVEQQRIVHAIDHHAVELATLGGDPALRRWLAATGRDALADVLAVRAALDPEAELAPLRARAARVVAAGDPLTIGELAITGEDVMGILGAGPGRAVGTILRGLLERVLEDPALNARERLEPLVRELAEPDEPDGSR